MSRGEITRRFQAASTVAVSVATILLARGSDQFSTQTEIVGSLASGQTSAQVQYSNPPRYRAFTFAAKEGDQIDVWVRSADGDAVAWIADSAFKQLARNDDADSTTLDAHVTLTLPANPPVTSAVYYVVFEEYGAYAASFTVSLVVTDSSTGPAKVFNPLDCRLNSGRPELSGHWKDDLNGQELDLSVAARAGTDDGQGRVTATYAAIGKVCRNPDSQGNPVPFQTDFEGDASAGGTIKGSIYWCNTRTESGRTFTTGIGRGDISLDESEDGKKLIGSFKGANGTESISFTRLSRVVPPPFRRQAIVQATADATIYSEPSTTSTMKPVSSTRAKFVIAEVKLDSAGNPTWYRVLNARGRAGVTGTGWISAGHLTCVKAQPE